MNTATARTAAFAGVLFAGLAVAPPATADEFSWQVSGSYLDDDMGDAVESDRSSLTATRYFPPVDDEAGPWELAPFLNRSSRVTVNIARSTLREQLTPWLAAYGAAGADVLRGGVAAPVIAVPPALTVDEPYPSPFALPADLHLESGMDATDYAVHGRYVWRGTGWYAGARAERGDLDPVPESPSSATNFFHDRMGLLAGRYIGSRTAVEVRLASGTQNQQTRSTGYFPVPVFGDGGFSDAPFFPDSDIVGLPPFVDPWFGSIDSETETEDVGLSVRHVGDAGEMTWSVAASVLSSRWDTRMLLPGGGAVFYTSGAIGDPPDRDRIVVDAGWLYPTEIFESGRERHYDAFFSLFPTRALGVHLGLSRVDAGEFGSSSLVSLSANWFLIRDAAAEIELARTSYGNGGYVPEYAYSPGPGGASSIRVRVLGRF